jgi:hypothetical protein
MTSFVVLLWLAAEADGDREQRLRAVIQQISESGRVVELAVTESERASPPREIAPGAPPLLSFRYFEGKDRHRFGRLDLVMDDAGH